MAVIGGFSLGAHPGGQSPAWALQHAETFRRAAALVEDHRHDEWLRQAQLLEGAVRAGHRIPDTHEARRAAVHVLTAARP